MNYKNIEKLNNVLEIMGYIDKYTHIGKKDLKIYSLLLRLISELEKSSKDINKAYYLFKMIDYLGYLPQTKKCAICGKNLIGDCFFIDMENGISICNTCYKGRKSGIIKIEKNIGTFINNPVNIENSLNKKEWEFLNIFLKNYLEHHSFK